MDVRYLNDIDTIGSLFWEKYVTLSHATYRGIWGALKKRGGGEGQLAW